MSGIHELKEKSKKQLQVNEKRKMGLDEMFENQAVGKPGNQKDGNQEIKTTKQLDNQQPINHTNQPSSQTDDQMSFIPPSKQTSLPQNRTAGHTVIHPVGKVETQIDVKTEAQPTRQPTILSKQSKNQKIPTCKMTFNLREDIHKAFNNLYANRILRGKATEKSEMICEAIQLLINMEEG